MKPLLLLIALTIGFQSCRTAKSRKKDPVKVERSLHGNWELTYISTEEDLFSFEELYPKQKPTISFDLKEAKVYGNTSCNSFGGELKITDNKIDFSKPMQMTLIACEGVGEQKFLDKLNKVDSYSISEDNVLALMNGDVAILRFVKK